MTVTSPNYDVFLSHSLKDKALASAVSARLKEAGLSVFSIWEQASADENIAEVTWNAFAESAALMLLVTAETGVAPALAMDVGAARAWAKPIYIVAEDGDQIEMPTYLQNVPVYSTSRLPEVINEIVRGSKPLDQSDGNILAAAYVDLGLTVDQILTQPSAMERLTRGFNSRTKTRVQGAKLVRELLRLRKTGRLHPHAARHTA